MLNRAANPPRRGHYRERDGQQRQNVPEGEHRDDAHDDPECGGDNAAAAMVPADRDVPHICLARGWGRRVLRPFLLARRPPEGRRLLKRLSDANAAPSG
jgi:hypothetical protein